MADVSEAIHRAPPVPRTRLMGREAEIAAGRRFLLDHAVGLLTLTGPGGVGKTRVARAIAAEITAQFADGVVWTDLALFQDEDQVSGAVASAVGFAAATDQSIAYGLAGFFRPLQALLLLDNCEHVLSGAAELVAAVLAGCPAVHVLATSRAPLRVRSEQKMPVEPLPLPPDSAVSLDVVQQSATATLFRERARAARPTFQGTGTNAAPVGEICRRLDSLPLAIELAAARLRIFPPEFLLAQVRDRLHLLADGPRDVPARQQTIVDTIAWSYDLLDPAAQRLFRRLAVFADGFTWDAALAVMTESGDSGHELMAGMAALVDQALVRQSDTETNPRFTVLETIREFGLEQLAARGEEADTRERHARRRHELIGSLDLYHANAGDEAWFGMVAAEEDNLRHVLAWFAGNDDDLALNDLSASLFKFWLAGARFGEGRRWLELATARDDGLPVLLRSRARGGMGFFAAWQGDFASAAKLLAEALALARASGDAIRLAEALLASGTLATLQGDLAPAPAYGEEAERVARGITCAAGPVLAEVVGTSLKAASPLRFDTGRSKQPRSVSRMPLVNAVQTPPGPWRANMPAFLFLRHDTRVRGASMPSRSYDLATGFSLAPRNHGLALHRAAASPERCTRVTDAASSPACEAPPRSQGDHRAVTANGRTVTVRAHCRLPTRA